MVLHRLLTALAAFLFVEGALSLQLAAAPFLRPATATARRSVTPTAQFGGDGKQPRGISRDSEPEEFFKTNMGMCAHCPARAHIDAHYVARARAQCPSCHLADEMTDAEKLKSPAVYIGLSILVLPFVVGMIALTLAK